MKTPMTDARLEIAKEMNLQLSVANTILSPGKFEGEHVSVLAFWNRYLDGFFDYENDDGDIVFILTDEEAAEFDGQRDYRLRLDDNGFVYGNV